LTLALGYPHPDHLMQAITGPQLADWLDFYAVEPWGDTRADLRAGIVAAVIANANRDAKRRPEPFTPADFMPLAPRREIDAAAPNIDDLRHALRGLPHDR